MLQRNTSDKRNSMLETLRPQWTAQLQQIIAFTEANKARVIGITSHDSGTGVTTLAQQLAQSYLSIGRSVALADLSHGTFRVLLADNSGSTWADVTSEHFSVLGIDPTEDEPHTSGSARVQLAALRARADTVIVDLPPASVKSADFLRQFLDAAPACDQVFMLCVTAQAYASEVRESVNICTIGGVALTGVVLNDFKLAATNVFGWQLPA